MVDLNSIWSSQLNYWSRKYQFQAHFMISFGKKKEKTRINIAHCKSTYSTVHHRGAGRFIDKVSVWKHFYCTFRIILIHPVNHWPTSIYDSKDANGFLAFKIWSPHELELLDNDYILHKIQSKSVFYFQKTSFLS